jgi:putative ABC transport system permease protein
MLKSVWMGLTTHKLRSFLTMLGIIIGVASVIALMSIGKGTTNQVLSNIESLGSNLITIRPGGTVGFGGVRGGPSTSTLTVDDANAIASQVSNVAYVAPVSTSSSQLIVGTENDNAQIYGTTPDYAPMNNMTIASGSFFNDQEYQRGAPVIVLGSNVASTLFPDPAVSPIGQQIRIGTKAIVTVIGVLESKGGMFNSVDDNVFIPLSLMQQTISQTINTQGQRVISNIVVSITDTNLNDQTVTDITNLLRTRHNLAESASNDFSIQSMSDIIASLQSTSNQLTLLLGAIAAIALLVGGIGVMNIMLVSVLERTREIGIRKALGAKNRDIWIQFLLEAGFLTLAGGVIGVGIGWGVSLIINKYKIMSLTTLVTPSIVIMAVSVAIGIGLFFGFYPAWNASRLDPIQALRSE